MSKAEMIYRDIILEKQERIAWLILNKPQVRNALGKQTLEEILAALDDIRRQPGIAVLGIKGAGGTFCTGMDLREISGPTGKGAEDLTRLADRVFLEIEKFKKVTLAVVSGYCIAGGFEIAIGCDFIIADENCKMGDGHINLSGFVPNGGASIRLPRLIGSRKAKELLLTGQLISGKDAEKIDLVNFAVAADKLDQAADTFVARLTDKSPIGLEYMKKLINASSECSLETGLTMERTAVMALGNSEDHYEAQAALKEKRKPFFKGK